MKKFALLFTGQGSQYVGMGKALCEKYQIARETYLEGGDILDMDLRALCENGPLHELTKTQNTQPAILVHSVALYRVFSENFGYTPAYMAGHSLGEISALCCSGAITFRDAVKITRKRGQLMDEVQGKGGMLSLRGIDYVDLQMKCIELSKDGHFVDISAYNSCDQIVVSVYTETLNRLEDEMKKIGVDTIALNVKTPFHTRIMMESAEKMEKELLNYKFDDLNVPVISNVYGVPYLGKDEIIPNLKHQIVRPVEWLESMKYLYRSGVETVIEMGPGTVLRNLMKRNIESINSFSYDMEEDGEKLKREFMVTEDRRKAVSLSLAIAVATPNLIQDGNYEEQVIGPYRQIERILKDLEDRDAYPTDAELKTVGNCLFQLLKNKGTSHKEIEERFYEVFEKTAVKLRE